MSNVHDDGALRWTWTFTLKQSKAARAGRSTLNRAKLVDARTQYEKKGRATIPIRMERIDKADRRTRQERTAHSDQGDGMQRRRTGIRFHTQGGDFLPETDYLKRGDPTRRTAQQPKFPASADAGADQEKRWEVAPRRAGRTPYRRRSLANWMTDVDEGAGRLLAPRDREPNSGSTNFRPRHRRHAERLRHPGRQAHCIPNYSTGGERIDR